MMRQRDCCFYFNHVTHYVTYICSVDFYIFSCLLCKCCKILVGINNAMYMCIVGDHNAGGEVLSNFLFFQSFNAI